MDILSISQSRLEKEKIGILGMKKNPPRRRRFSMRLEDEYKEPEDSVILLILHIAVFFSHHDSHLSPLCTYQSSRAVGPARGIKCLSQRPLRSTSNDRRAQIGRGNTDGDLAALDLPGQLVHHTHARWRVAVLTGVSPCVTASTECCTPDRHRSEHLSSPGREAAQGWRSICDTAGRVHWR